MRPWGFFSSDYSRFFFSLFFFSPASLPFFCRLLFSSFYSPLSFFFSFLFLFPFLAFFPSFSHGRLSSIVYKSRARGGYTGRELAWLDRVCDSQVRPPPAAVAFPACGRT